MGKWRNPRENKGEHMEKEGIFTEDREDLRLAKLMEHDTKPWRTKKTNGLKTNGTIKVKENHEKKIKKNYWKKKGTIGKWSGKNHQKMKENQWKMKHNEWNMKENSWKIRKKDYWDNIGHMGFYFCSPF